MQDPDSDLVLRARSGDRTAFGILVDRHYEMVYALAYGVLHEREAARDTAQEVFLKVFREIEKFEGRSKFKTWLHRVVVNAALDEGRRRRPAESIDRTGEDDDRPRREITETGPGPRELASRREMRELVEEAMAKLSPDHRAVLVLREWEGLSYEEIAETLGIEMGTVMSRLFYARKRLEEIVKIKIQK